MLARRPRLLPLRTPGAARGLSGAAAGGVAAATSSLALPAQFVISAQAATGAPWWLAIGSSTIALRFGLLPLFLYQLRETRRLAALRPALLAIRQECRSLSPPSYQAWTTASRMYRYCRGVSVQPLAIIVLPLLQIPILVYSVISVRQMVLPSSPLASQLRAGGPTALPDLTRADASWLLPAASVCLTLANLQLAIPSSATPFWLFARNLWQALAVLSFPLFTQLPAGVFACWIPNSTFSLAQHVLSKIIRAVPLGAPAAAGAVAAGAVGAQALAATALGRALPLPASTAALTGRLLPALGAATSLSTPALPLVAAAATAEAPISPPGEVDVVQVVARSKELLKQNLPSQAVDLLWPAVQACERAASAPLRFQLALALALQKQHGPAEELLKQVLEIEPSFAEAHVRGFRKIDTLIDLYAYTHTYIYIYRTQWAQNPSSCPAPKGEMRRKWSSPCRSEILS